MKYILATLAMVLLPMPAMAMPLCENAISPLPSAESREVEFGDTAFSTPSNYRAIAQQDGSIEILDPSTYAYFQCLTEVGYGEGGRESITVSLSPVTVGAQGWVRATGLTEQRSVQVTGMERGDVDGMATGTIYSEWEFDGAHVDYFQNLPTGGSIRISVINPEAFGNAFQRIIDSVKILQPGQVDETN